MTEQRGFVDVVREHDRRLRALAYRMLGDRDRMDDVLQDAYTSAFRSYERFRGESGAGTWLYRIVYNACLDDLRRRRPDPVRLEETDEVTADHADTAAHRADLASALASLRPEHRAAVLLVDADGFTYAEAARICDVQEGTIASRLSEARRALRRALSTRGDGR